VVLDACRQTVSLPPVGQSTSLRAHAAVRPQCRTSLVRERALLLWQDPDSVRQTESSRRRVAATHRCSTCYPSASRTKRFSTAPFPKWSAAWPPRRQLRGQRRYRVHAGLPGTRTPRHVALPALDDAMNRCAANPHGCWVSTPRDGSTGPTSRLALAARLPPDAADSRPGQDRCADPRLLLTLGPGADVGQMRAARR
jgi:hypothetical protein